MDKIDETELNMTFDMPETVDQAVEVLVKMTPKEDLETISKMSKENLISLHHGYGTCIRNEFKLWAGNSSLLNSCAKASKKEVSHPDDASMVIIEALWKKIKR
jgi:hypothetical protein